MAAVQEKLEDMKAINGRNNNGTPKPSLTYAIISWLPDFILCVAIALGWYIRWQYYGYSVLLALGWAGLAIFVLNIIGTVYFRSSCLGCVAHLWFGCLLGMISLYDISPNLQHYYNNLEEVMNLLLVASLLCKFLVDLLCKFCRGGSPHVRNPAVLWPRSEWFEVCGAAVACILAGTNTQPLIVLLTAFASALTAIKLGSWVSCANLAFLMITAEAYLFPDLHMSVNPYGIICFTGRLIISPLLDLLVGGQSRLEKWQGFIFSRRILQRLVFLCFVAAEAIFFALHASVVKNHKEWYVVVPFFVAASIFWFLMHFIFLMIFATLINRFVRCRDHLGMVTGLLSLKKVLAARGLRYFSLIAQRLMSVCVVTSIMIGILCWTTRTPYNHSLLAIVLALEVMIAELLHEFSASLGGTCIGYSVIAPVTAVRTDGMVTVLPPNFMQEAGSRSTQTLQAVVDFFTQHMITNYGCDWSMSGVSIDGLEKKLDEFFAQTTVEGPRYDTYLLYYSGPTSTNGDWALTGGCAMSLDRLLTLWEEKNQGSSCRLLLVCDTENSSQWTKPVWRLKGSATFVGLQTAKHVGKKVGADALLSIGDYTKLWVDYNSGGNRAVFDSSLRTVRPVYAVSRRWTDFHFHLPTSDEIRNYWLQTLPRVTHACMAIVIGILSARVPLTCCECCARIVRRCRMQFWPPAELDTGHGFKLIRI